MRRLLFYLTLFFLTSATAQPAGEEKATFRKVLETIGNENPAVLSAQYVAFAQKSQQLANLLAWTPLITASARQGIKEWGLDSGEVGQVEARLNLFRFGGDVSRAREALNSRQQADLKSTLAILQTEEKAARIVFQWIELKSRLASQKILFESKKRLSRVAQERFRQGRLPDQEVEKVRLDASNAEVQIGQAEVTLLELKSQLDALLPGASLIQTWPWTSMSETKPPKRAKDLHQRMNFQVLNLEREIRGSRSWQSTATWLPSLDLRSTWETNQVKPLGQGEWASSLILTIPLWDQAAALSGRGYWLELQKAAEQDLEQYRRDESLRLQTLEERKEKLRQNLVLALDSSRRARSLAEESFRRFQLGRTSVNDLLIDQSRVFEAESLAQQALSQFHLILLETCLSADERPSRCY